MLGSPGQALYLCLQVLVPRCSHWPVDGQLQPGTECAWVSVRLCGRQQRQRGRGSGGEAVWCSGWLHGGWSWTTWALVPNPDSTRDCPMPLFLTCKIKIKQY